MEQADAWHLTGELGNEHGKGDPFAAAVRATRMAMVVTDPRQPDNPIVFANDAFLKLSGYARDEIMGKNCRFLQGPGTDPEEIRQVREAVSSNCDIAIDLLNYRKDRTPFWNALYLSPVINEAGELLYFFASQLDVPIASRPSSARWTKRRISSAKSPNAHRISPKCSSRKHC